MKYILPDLDYDYNALEPFIDAWTMELHHSKHHAGYTNNLNNAIESVGGIDYSNIDDILKNISKLPVSIRNNGGGYYNHNLFWKIISPNGGGVPGGDLKDAIVRDFGSFENFKKEFGNAAATRFGSGWAWLIKNDNDKLEIYSTPNQDNPLMDVSEKNGSPILALDVWEHAYYLKYQNKRPEYIEAFWNIINWSYAELLFKK